MKKFTESQLKLAQLQFVTEAAQYYNSTNRGIKPFTAFSCSYLAGCAIGRHCEPILCIELDGLIHSGVSHPSVFKRLPIKLRRLKRSFLAAVQGLHDMSSHWDEDGLTPEGMLAFENIVANIMKGKYLKGGLTSLEF
jgi:hypothetical protein